VFVGFYALPSLKATGRYLAHYLWNDYPFAPDYALKESIKDLETYEGFDGASRSAIWNKNALALFPRFGAKRLS
jgi:hypothetical protein